MMRDAVAMACRGFALAMLCALACGGSAAARADAVPDEVERPVDTVAVATAVATPEAAGAVSTVDGLEALVPEVAHHPYRVEPGVRPFRNRLAFSPGYGSLGAKRLFVARVTYHPNAWLGYEWAIGHNPGQSVHAALHTLSAIVRRPLSGRLQPYVSGGYGMMLVFPGQSLNAAPVTKNAFAIGGGLEFYIRGDLAVRADVRRATVLGRERDRDGIVAYDYLQQTIGLAFYRSIRP
jgi:opacity protein-like surface antigen